MWGGIRGESGIFSYKRQECKSSPRDRLQYAAPFWRERADHLLRRWWIVDYYMLWQRKAYWWAKGGKTWECQRFTKWKTCSTFPVLERKGEWRTSVESRIHFVRTKECSRMLNISFIKIFRIPSYLSFMHNPERSGFLPTRESVYMLKSPLNLHQAL